MFHELKNNINEIKKDINNKKLWEDLGVLLFDYGKIHFALKIFKCLSKNWEIKDKPYFFYEGICYYELGRFDAAREKFNEEIKYFPNNPISYKYLGLISNYSEKKYNRAIQYFLKSIKRINSSIIYIKKNESLDENTKLLKILKKINHKNDIMFEIAKCYNGIREYNKSLKYLDRILNIDKNYIDAIYFRAYPQIGLGFINDALNSYVDGFNREFREQLFIECIENLIYYEYNNEILELEKRWYKKIKDQKNLERFNEILIDLKKLDKQ
jgi:tetratricopeptide (TPR) repeat protein